MTRLGRHKFNHLLTTPLNVVTNDDKCIAISLSAIYINTIDDVYHKGTTMTMLSRHRINGRRDTRGRWRIARTIHGRSHSELYPDLRSATRRLCQIAREQRRQLKRRRQGGLG